LIDMKLGYRIVSYHIKIKDQECFFVLYLHCRERERAFVITT
jgi:hypothetical protein